MALTFPVSPVDGDVFLSQNDGRRYQYSLAKNRWFLQGGKAIAADLKPTNPHDGEIYFSKVTGVQEVYSTTATSWIPLVSSGVATADPFLQYTSIIVTGEQNPIVNEAPAYPTLTITSSSVTQDTGNSVSGTGSLLFGGTSQIIASSPLLDGLVGEYSFETWLYITAYPTSNIYGIFFFGNAGSNNYRAQLGLDTAGSLNFFTNITTTNSDCKTSNGIVPLNTWTHIAATRTRYSHMVFVNGAMVKENLNIGSYASFVNAPTANRTDIRIGVARSASALRYLTGNMDGVRLTNHPRYTGPFVPPLSIPLA